MSKQETQQTFEFKDLPTIKGFPELRWTGKRPYHSTQYFPAQLRERYGTEQNGWINKIFWGDNLQVMSHLLKEFRGKVDLIYIDPPFDSKADYKKKIKLHGKDIVNDSSSFEEKQYGDIWTNDEYLQFMYERLILLRELLSETGSIYLHCDWHKMHYLRFLLDEIFGNNNFRNEIVWGYRTGGISKGLFARKHDNLLFFAKNNARVNFNTQYYRSYQQKKYNFKGVEDLWDEEKKQWYHKSVCRDIWEDIYPIGTENSERLDYPTQKPEALIERIINASSNPGDIVFDCFMGSGTTQAMAMRLGRRFIGADINLGAIQTTTKRLLSVADELQGQDDKYTGFEVYNVNHYDFFRNPVQAKDLLIEALEIQPFSKSGVWDGELDGRMVKIMPVNRIAAKADLEELKANLPYKTYEKRKEEHPHSPVEKITLVCMGHVPDLKAALENEVPYKIDIEIVDILRDKTDLQLKREAEAKIIRRKGKLIIESFYPLNLMQKLSLQKEYVEDWRQLVDSIMIDWNYDGAVMNPTVTDIPDKKSLVKGEYDIPKDAGTIRIKITDLLSESLEKEVK